MKTPNARAFAPSPPQEGGREPDPMLEAKLWRNPCGFAFRLNYLALCYNLPLYDWVRRRYGLSRPEYVALYSLALCEGGRACDITRTSGFPKNTLSRAVARLEALDLVTRRPGVGDRRNQALFLSPAGRALFDETVPAFVRREAEMLAALTVPERATLARLMAKMVGAMSRPEDGGPGGPGAKPRARAQGGGADASRQEKL